MKTIYKTIIAAALSCLLFSCAKEKALDGRITSLELQVAELQGVLDKSNTNSIAVRKLLNEKTVIYEYEINEYGAFFNIGGGEFINIYYGETAPWIVPILGIDGKGNWIVSIDGGETFSPVQGSVNINDTRGQSPLMGVDAEGYWRYSFDNGLTYTYILDNDGNKISAVDGRGIAGKYLFFKSVGLDPTDPTRLVVKLVNGETWKIPLSSSVSDDFYVKVNDYIEEDILFPEDVLTYNQVGMKNVASAIFQGPEGWNITLTDSKMTVSAPSDFPEEDTLVKFNLIVVSTDGRVKTYEFTFWLLA